VSGTGRRKRGQAPAPESVPPLTSMPPTARESAKAAGVVLHTYMVQQHQMRPGFPLTFSDGERIVAVLSSSPVPGYGRTGDIDVTVLVELP
jgi:hypothetical protein